MKIPHRSVTRACYFMLKPSNIWPRIIHISYWTPFFIIPRPVRTKKKQPQQSYHAIVGHLIVGPLQWFCTDLLYLRSNNLLLKFIWFHKVFANAPSWMKCTAKTHQFTSGRATSPLKVTQKPSHLHAKKLLWLLTASSFVLQALNFLEKLNRKGKQSKSGTGRMERFKL